MSWLTGFYNYFQDEAEIDDFVDRLGRKHLMTALGCFTVVLASAEFIGDPINCFPPPGYNSMQVDFINTICHAQSLYYVFNENMTSPQPQLGGHAAHANNVPLTGAKALNYYKYAPVLLFFMLFFFMLPYFFWEVWQHSLLGLDLHNILDSSGRMLEPISIRHRESQAKDIAERLHFFKQLERPSKTRSSFLRKAFPPSSRAATWAKLAGASPVPPGASLFSMYLLIKVLYLVDVALNLVILSYFLDVSLADYLSRAWIFSSFQGHSDIQGQLSPRFPTTVICSYTGEAQVMGKLLRLTSLCSIPLNIYYDKVFGLLYLFLAVLFVLFAISIFVWLYKCAIKKSFLHKYLHGVSGVGQLDFATEQAFVAYLSTDLIFILRLIEKATDGIVVFTIVHKLKDKFVYHHEIKNTQTGYV